MQGDLLRILDDLGSRGVLQLLVEGGATVAHAFHTAGLVDRYVLYMAPALFGGDDGAPVFSGPGADTIDALRRVRIVEMRRVGDDLRLDLEGM
jgi:diaminohydroxyphosphoribosylaminopyrimidine deaminase/5-amino-6-(5-phosphoribosylamino)uracil reductase